MGKNSGLRSSNEIYLAEFIEVWSSIDYNVWERNGNGTVGLGTSAGWLAAEITAINGESQSLAALPRFPSGNNPLFGLEQDQAECFINKMVLEFLLIGTQTLTNNVTIEFGLNEITALALHTDMLFFRIIEPAGTYEIVRRRAGAETTIAIADFTLSHRFKIELLRNRVNFYVNNVFVGGFDPALSAEPFRFWARVVTVGGGDTGQLNIGPIHMTLERL